MVYNKRLIKQQRSGPLDIRSQSECSLIHKMMKYSIGYDKLCFMIIHDEKKEDSVVYSNIRENKIMTRIRKVLKNSKKTAYVTNEDIKAFENYL